MRALDSCSDEICVLQASAQAGELVATQPYLLQQHQSPGRDQNTAPREATAASAPAIAASVAVVKHMHRQPDALPQACQAQLSQQGNVKHQAPLLPSAHTTAGAQGRQQQQQQQENVTPAGIGLQAKPQAAVGSKSEALAAALQRLKVSAPPLEEQDPPNGPTKGAHISSRGGQSITPPSTLHASALLPPAYTAPRTSVGSGALGSDDAWGAQDAPHAGIYGSPEGSAAEAADTAELQDASFQVSARNEARQMSYSDDVAAARSEHDAGFISGCEEEEEGMRERSGNTTTAGSASEDDVQCTQRPPGETRDRPDVLLIALVPETGESSSHRSQEHWGARIRNWPRLTHVRCGFAPPGTRATCAVALWLHADTGCVQLRATC